MGCRPTFQKPQPGQKFSWEMLYHRCASDFGRAETALDCYEREAAALRKENSRLSAEAAALRKENAQLLAKLDACASLTQTLKADTAIMGAAETTGSSLKLGAVAVAALVAGFFAGRKTKS